MGFDEAGFADTVSTIYITPYNTSNVNSTTAYVLSTTILGEVNSAGQVTLPTGTPVKTGNIWYSPGTGVATTGAGLFSSTTAQATFLKASPGYTP